MLVTMSHSINFNEFSTTIYKIFAQINYFGDSFLVFLSKIEIDTCIKFIQSADLFYSFDRTAIDRILQK